VAQRAHEPADTGVSSGEGGRSAFSRVTSLALGILAGVGGFVDFGGIITSVQAGAQFRFALVWTVIFGLIGFAVYAEMSGRIAISTGRAMYDVIRDRLGARLALLPLITTTLSQLLTIVVEFAGITLVAQYVTHISYLLWVPLAALLLAGILWRASFEQLDNSAALLGLTMLVSIVIMVKATRSWGGLAVSLIHPSMVTAHPLPMYLFMVVSLLGAYMTPYQFTFYSSGALEEEWEGMDLVTNRVVSLVGTGFGGFITIALMVEGAAILFPHHHQVATFADVVLPAHVVLGVVGVAIFLIGTFAVSLGAGLETTLSGSYAIMQYLGWDWGKRGKPRDAPAFQFTMLLLLALALVITETRVDPISVTTFTMAIGAVTLPLNFLPLLLVANDKAYMGDQTNSLGTNVVAIVILAVLALVTVTAIPLMFLSGSL
jgi:manganese transport protein